MKKILNILKKILAAPFIIYLYNLIAAPLNIIIPINIFTVALIGFLGIPGLITLIVFYLIAF